MHGAPPKNLREAIVSRFTSSSRAAAGARALLVLGFIFLYKLGDSMATALATSFYLDIGFIMTQIGVIAKTTGFWASIAGGMIGGVWLVKIGINRGLWIFGVLQSVGRCSASRGSRSIAAADALLLGRAVIGFESASASAWTTAAFIAYIASTTDPRYTATQYALFTSLAAVPRTLASASSGLYRRADGLVRVFHDLHGARLSRHVTVAENRALESPTMTVHARSAPPS